MNIIYSKLRYVWGTILFYKYKLLYEKDPHKAADALYYKIFKRHLNFNNPQNLIEKIAWLSLNTDTSMWTLCADKYRMRSYIKEKGLENYLPHLYGHWDNPFDIDFSLLPDSFVLKSNNGCETVLLVRDKKLIDVDKTKELLKRWLSRPFGYMGAQVHYLKIKPCIIAEELLVQDAQEKSFSPDSIVDYKIWTFNGIPESVLIVYNRRVGHMNLALYDINWNPIPKYLRNGKHYSVELNLFIPKPECFDQMKEIAAKLGKGFKEVRIDFYVINGKPIIGEMTFTSGYGYFTDEYYDYLGSKIDL